MERADSGSDAGGLDSCSGSGTDSRFDPAICSMSLIILPRSPDVAWLGINPLLHYFVFGSAENRKPNCLFDGDFYRKYNPDVALSMMNPLLHYWKWGALEGRNPHPEFDSRYSWRNVPSCTRKTGIPWRTF